jgi:hypothetical protein
VFPAFSPNAGDALLLERLLKAAPFAAARRLLLRTLCRLWMVALAAASIPCPAPAPPLLPLLLLERLKLVLFR